MALTAGGDAIKKNKRDPRQTRAYNKVYKAKHPLKVRTAKRNYNGWGNHYSNKGRIIQPWEAEIILTKRWPTSVGVDDTRIRKLGNKNLDRILSDTDLSILLDRPVGSIQAFRSRMKRKHNKTLLPDQSLFSAKESALGEESGLIIKWRIEVQKGNPLFNPVLLLVQA